MVSKQKRSNAFQVSTHAEQSAPYVHRGQTEYWCIMQFSAIKRHRKSLSNTDSVCTWAWALVDLFSQCSLDSCNWRLLVAVPLWKTFLIYLFLLKVFRLSSKIWTAVCLLCRFSCLKIHFAHKYFDFTGLQIISSYFVQPKKSENVSASL